MKPPTFLYHPDPLATGAVIESTSECEACGEARGYIYTGPVASEEDLTDSICPWCIANGTAAREFGAEFTDAASIGTEDDENPVPEDVVAEVAYKTPGFTGWQQERWLSCCGDAAVYLGSAGHAELEQKWPRAALALKIQTGMKGEAWERFFASLNLDSGPTAYVFQCLHCRRYLVYSDSP